MAIRGTNMRLYQLYLPTTLEDTSLEAEERTWLWEELCRFAGGCTVIGDVAGFWRDRSASTVTDAITLVLVLAPETSQSERFFRRIAERLVDRLGQQELYVHSLPVELIIAASNTAPSWPRAAD